MGHSFSFFTLHNSKCSSKINIFYTDVNSKKDLRSVLSHEKQSRVDVAVSKLGETRKVVSSKTLDYTHDQVMNFFNLGYSQEYINQMFKSKINTRHCGQCTSLATSAMCGMCGSSDIYNGTYLDSDTIMTDTTRCAMLESAKVMMQIVDSRAKNSYALIRPPGHHSCNNHHEGFCTFNNAILMSKYIGNEGILIIDWDVHHGNGTQKFVQDMQNLYYVSMHHFDGVFYPKTGSTAENTNRILNVPFKKNICDDEYLNLFRSNVIPFVDNISHNISTIIISNGLDAHIDDPFKVCNLTEKSYVEMTKYFKSKGKRLVYLLEGGYNENVIANVSESILKVFD